MKENLLKTPKKSATVRMYRQGHGDCFLIAFARKGNTTPYYVLIDCGLKPGSQNFIHKKEGSDGFADGPEIEEIVEHIGQSTNFHLDLMIVTHEHQDHVNGIWKKTNPYFEKFEIDEAWFAWTEDPTDELANSLRKKHHDQLVGLIAATDKLASFETDDRKISAVSRLNELLGMEIGGQQEVFGAGMMGAAASDPAGSVNKQAMKFVKDKASQKRGVRYLNPGDHVVLESGEPGIGVYVLGPPRSETLLVDEDPVGSEGFPDAIAASHNVSFMAAVKTDPGCGATPFDPRFNSPFSDNYDSEDFFVKHYGFGPKASGIPETIVEADADMGEVKDNADWRRIDEDWLSSAENLALKLNTGINNTSLVLAFELPFSKKVLFFAGDAQRGNWISWDDQTWGASPQTISAKDILSRAVLYKVGHHGSHNATLAGKVTDEHASLSWMGQGKFSGEFTAMITAVNKWAMTKNSPPWRHPLPSIRKALEEKTAGRIFQTDISTLTKPVDVSDSAWKKFLGKCAFDRLFFDYTVMDS